MQVELTKEDLLIFDDQNEEIYSIKRINLADALSKGNESDWINQLSEKSWADKSLLFEVANIIKKDFPKNNINWDATNKIIDSIN